ncbi:MAG TPA: hypothetical protein PK365_20325, partial [Nitrospira sp.]|nr:hypothetical protein [Nitrospira sp.]
RLTSISPHGTSLRTFQQVKMVRVEYCLNAPAKAAALVAVVSPFLSSSFPIMRLSRRADALIMSVR